MNMTAAPSCRSTRRRFATRRGGSATGASARSRSPRSSRRSIPATSARRAAIVAEEIPGCRHHLLVRPRPDRPARARERGAPQRRARRSCRATTVAAFEQAIADSGISAPLYITQNDGTVAEAGQAHAAAGLYLRLRGDELDARRRLPLGHSPTPMVVDVGGTTTDVGQLKSGFPREANSVVKIGGVRTLFRMPDLLSIGLGGGSHVSLDPVAVGPLSVGYRLTAGRARLRRRAAHRERYRHRGGAARYRRPGKGGAS